MSGNVSKIDGLDWWLEKACLIARLGKYGMSGETHDQQLLPSTRRVELGTKKRSRK